jgi:C1 domain
VRSKCDICGKTAKGYNFCCNACGFAMHPCCATLYPQMNFLTHQHPLYITNFNGESSFLCQICRRKRAGQVYQCKPCRYYLHAVCAKDFINGLYTQGVVPPEKKGSIAKIARAALHLVFEAIGGLIEGIGEGIGESLVGSIGKGLRSRSIKKREHF